MGIWGDQIISPNVRTNSNFLMFYRLGAFPGESVDFLSCLLIGKFLGRLNVRKKCKMCVHITSSS